MTINEDTKFIDIYEIDHDGKKEFIFTVYSDKERLSYDYYRLTITEQNEPVIIKANDLVKRLLEYSNKLNKQVKLTPVSKNEDLYLTFISAYSTALRRKRKQMELHNNQPSPSLIFKPTKKESNN